MTNCSIKAVHPQERKSIREGRRIAVVGLPNKVIPPKNGSRPKKLQKTPL